MGFLDASIVLIALPAIFRGIHLDPLQPSNSGYLLWMLLGYLVVTAVLVVTFGRIGDMYGRVRVYTLGFAVFTVGSAALALVPARGASGAMELIVLRIVQGVGGAMLMANSSAIITDAFPAEERGKALGVNQIFTVLGTFSGLVLGGVLASVDWRLVFWVNVPIGIVGTLWARHTLREVAVREPTRLDLAGNVVFGTGLVAVLLGITYGIRPYGGHEMGWTGPAVIGELAGGVLLLVVFCRIELHASHPMLDLRLFRVRAFASGIGASLLAAIARGGVQFMVAIWLQGIWLPLRGVGTADTPLRAGLYMLPLTLGLLMVGPASGYLSDRWGSRPFAVTGLLLAGLSMVLLLWLPADFPYWALAGVLLLNGMGQALFLAPNVSSIMTSVPATHRGAASGVIATSRNSGVVISIGTYFTLLVLGLGGELSRSLSHSLLLLGVAPGPAAKLAHLSPVSVLFAAFLGYNPFRHGAGPALLAGLGPAKRAVLTSGSFLPHAIAGPFLNGVRIAALASAGMFLVAAAASYTRGARVPPSPARARPLGKGEEGARVRR
jgi:MFS family permease